MLLLIKITFHILSQNKEQKLTFSIINLCSEVIRKLEVSALSLGGLCAFYQGWLRSWKLTTSWVPAAHQVCSWAVTAPSVGTGVCHRQPAQLQVLVLPPHLCFPLALLYF